jgi:hypothetical protein
MNFVFRKVCVLLGRGLCDGLITRPEEYYRMCYVAVCDWETSRLWIPWTRVGPHHHRKFWEINKESNRIVGEEGVILCVIV